METVTIPCCYAFQCSWVWC